MPTELTFLKILLDAHLSRARSERGVSAVEWVLITALLVAIAGAVYVILRQTITDKANDIDLSTP